MSDRSTNSVADNSANEAASGQKKAFSTYPRRCLVVSSGEPPSCLLPSSSSKTDSNATKEALVSTPGHVDTPDKLIEEPHKDKSHKKNEGGHGKGVVEPGIEPAGAKIQIRGEAGYLELDPMVVSIEPIGRSRHLKVSIVIETTPDRRERPLPSHEPNPRRAEYLPALCQRRRI